MSIKAFIVAIEKYSGYLPDLPGVSAEADAFRQWLLKTKNIAPADIYACAGEDCDWRTTGTTSDEIINELGALINAGANKTEELYFYFAGHGFSSPASTNINIDTDVLVASNFDNRPASGRACISLDEIKARLYYDLGPGDHYYFIDACRNEIPVAYAQTGLQSKRSELGTPSVYRVFSTSSGDVSKTSRGFSGVLIAGLSGGGIAKEWRRGQMWVVFDRLCEYIKGRIKKQKIFYNIEGSGTGMIFKLAEIPELEYRIVVKNAEATDNFTLNITDDRGREIKSENFAGPQYLLDKFLPGDYDVSLTFRGMEIPCSSPEFTEPPFALYDSGEINFDFQRDRYTGPYRFNTEDTWTNQSFELNLGDNPRFDEILLKNIDPKDTRGWGTGPRDRRQGDGPRRSHTPTLGGTRRSSKTVVDLDPAIVEYTPPEILAQLKASGKSDTAAEFNRGLWLSLIGASRIVSGDTPRRKLNDLDLDSFEDMPRDASGIFVLAGFKESEQPLEVGLGIPAAWQPTSAVRAGGAFQASLPASSGSHFLSLKRPGLTTFTYSVFCLPNRVTLFVADEDQNGQLSIKQFILPVCHLFGYLEPRVLEHMIYDPLKVIKAITLAQRQFSLKRPLTADNVFTEDELKILVNRKWLDPVMSLIGAYELLRLGQNKGDNKLHLREMIGNLRRYFPGIPDTEAIARLIGEPWIRPGGPPLMLEGLMAFEDQEQAGFAPPEGLDYGSLWTRWFGRVQ